MSDKILDRELVLSKAVDDCRREMFAKAQPSADYDNLIAEYKAGKIDEEKDGPVYNRHYLSMEEYIYILDKYLDAYRIKSEWKEDVGVVEEYLKEGGSKDKYIDEHTDENGDWHPGYRGYEKVKPIKEQILYELYKWLDNDNQCEGCAEAITKIVMDTIDTCKNFYNFNMDECKFRNTMAFSATPTSNAETVKKWWKDHYDVDIEIEERNPLLLWEYENYGDEIDEIMSEEYGDNWKEIWDKKWKDQIAEKEAKYQELKKQFEKENESKE